MRGKFRTSALVAAALKCGQQVLHDFDHVVRDDTSYDLARYCGEQFLRVAAPVAAAVGVNKAISYLESPMPKPLRGALTLAAATLGVGALAYCGQQFTNVQPEQATSVMQASEELVRNYSEALVTLTRDPIAVNAGYLTGALTSVLAAGRWTYNLIDSLAQASERKLKKEQAETRTMSTSKAA